MSNFFVYNYNDHMGEGSFGIRHLIMVLAVIAIEIGVWFLARKKGEKTIPLWKAIAVIMFTVRFTQQVGYAVSGVEEYALKCVPWHMCTLMSFLLPIVFFFQIEWLKTPIYIISLLGGVITFIIGDFFESSFLWYGSYESILAHTVLIALPIADAALGRFRFDIKKWWQPTVCIAACCVWATIGNLAIFKAIYHIDVNYMYLMKNALPFDIPGVPFFLIYVVIYFVLLFATYGVAHLCGKRARQEAKA